MEEGVKPLAEGNKVRFKLGANTGNLPMLSVGRIIRFAGPDNQYVLVEFAKGKKVWTVAGEITHVEEQE